MSVSESSSSTPSTIAAPSALSGQQSQLQKREKVLSEIMSSESTYYQRLLTMRDVFLIPLRESAATKTPIIPLAAIKVYDRITVVGGLHSFIISVFSWEMEEGFIGSTLLR